MLCAKNGISGKLEKEYNMKKTNVELKTLNQISEEFIIEHTDPKKGLIKVVTERYFEPSENDEDYVRQLCEEWFDTCAGRSHAYRDGSKVRYENLLSVEIIKK